VSATRSEISGVKSGFPLHKVGEGTFRILDSSHRSGSRFITRAEKCV
jgi:hypothetical protein